MNCSRRVSVVGSKSEAIGDAAGRISERPRHLLLAKLSRSTLRHTSLRGSGTAMTERVLLIEDAPEVGYVARALGASIVTEADDLPTLREAIRESVRRHFDGPDVPPAIPLHFVRDEVMGHEAASRPGGSRARPGTREGVRLQGHSLPLRAPARRKRVHW